MSVAPALRKRQPPLSLTSDERLRGALSHLGDALRLLAGIGGTDGGGLVVRTVAAVLRAEIRRLRDMIDEALAEHRPAKRRRA